MSDFNAKMLKNRLFAGALTQTSLWGTYSIPHSSRATLEGSNSKGKEGREKERGREKGWEWENGER